MYTKLDEVIDRVSNMKVTASALGANYGSDTVLEVIQEGFEAIRDEIRQPHGTKVAE